MSVQEKFDQVYQGRKLKAQVRDGIEFQAYSAAYKSMERQDQETIYACWQNLRKNSGQNLQAGAAYHIFARLGVFFAEHGM